MSSHLAHAQLLLQTHRPADAEKAAREGLDGEPNNPLLLFTLGCALIEQEKFAEARVAAEQLLQLAPGWEQAHHLVTNLELEARHYKAAEASAREALRLSPNSVAAHYNLALCLTRLSRWPEALEQAEAGLALNPEHDGCANLRATALANLGRDIESWHSTAGALRRNPENPATHVTAGFVKLQGGEREPALEHFTEALRLDPTNEQARQGLLLAMKARNPVYRLLLRYSFWMMRMPPARRWQVMVGAIIAINVIDHLPGLGIWGPLAELAYFSFFMLTWIGTALFDFLLLLDSRARHVLQLRERLAAVALVACLGCALAWIGFCLAWDAEQALWALDILLFAIPLTRVFHRRRGWKKPAALAITALFGLWLVAALGLVVTTGDYGLASGLVLVLVLYTWLARFLED